MSYSRRRPHRNITQYILRSVLMKFLPFLTQVQQDAGKLVKLRTTWFGCLLGNVQRRIGASQTTCVVKRDRANQIWSQSEQE